MAVLGLCFCARAFSSCGKRGPLFIVVHGPLTIAASLVAEHRLQTRRLSNCGSAACGIFPDQGSNPFPLHWQADSQPLRHQGSPHVILLWHWSCSFHPFRSFASAVCACTRVHTRTHTHTVLSDWLPFGFRLCFSSQKPSLISINEEVTSPEHSPTVDLISVW